MHALVLIAIGLAVGLPVGTIWGRKLEQKALGVALYEYQRVNAGAHKLLADLETKLPWLGRHLHL